MTYGSELITFNKARMNEALGKISNLFPDYYSPYFWCEEEDFPVPFPVRFWHETRGLSFDGKDWDIIRLDEVNHLQISKGVRLR